MSVWLNYARPDGGAHPLHARQFDAVITPMRAPASGPALQMEFPAAEAFTIAFDLPEGWTVQARDAEAGQDTGEPLALASVASVYDLYDAQVTAEQQRSIASSLEFQK